MNTYVDYSGWTDNTFPEVIVQTVPQSSGGVDDFGNPIFNHNFKTTEVESNTVIGQAWYTWIIPITAINNEIQVKIDVNVNGNPNVLTPIDMEPTIYQYTFIYTGTTIPQDIYRVYTTFPSNIFKISNTNNIYFRGNDTQP
jgi:hypothetical protein